MREFLHFFRLSISLAAWRSTCISSEIIGCPNTLDSHIGHLSTTHLGLKALTLLQWTLLSDLRDACTQTIVHLGICHVWSHIRHLLGNISVLVAHDHGMLRLNCRDRRELLSVCCWLDGYALGTWGVGFGSLIFDLVQLVAWLDKLVEADLEYLWDWHPHILLRLLCLMYMKFILLVWRCFRHQFLLNFEESWKYLVQWRSLPSDRISELFQ